MITYISKHPQLPDGIPFLPAINGLPFYKDGPNLLTYLKEFREVAREYGAIQIGEAPMTPVKTALRYLTGEDRVLDMMIQFDTMMADCFLTEFVHHGFWLAKLKRAFSRWQYALAGKAWNALYLENHDHPRVISRYGSEKYWRESGTMLAACYLFQQGTPFIYQGQEIGMTNIRLSSIDQYKDVASIHAYHAFYKHGSEEKRMHRIHLASRDSARTPMQWSVASNAGFSSAQPWFAVNPNYTQINVEQEERDPDSILNFYRRCLALRKSSQTFGATTGNTTGTAERSTFMSAAMRESGFWSSVPFQSETRSTCFPKAIPKRKQRCCCAITQRREPQVSFAPMKLEFFSGVQSNRPSKVMTRVYKSTKIGHKRRKVILSKKH